MRDPSPALQEKLADSGHIAMLDAETTRARSTTRGCTPQLLLVLHLAAVHIPHTRPASHDAGRRPVPGMWEGRGGLCLSLRGGSEMYNVDADETRQIALRR